MDNKMEKEIAFYFVYFSWWLYPMQTFAILCDPSLQCHFLRTPREIDKIDNYGRVGCHVSKYLHTCTLTFRATSRKIISHMTTDRGRLKLQFRNCAILPRTGAGYSIPFSESTYALCLSEPPKYIINEARSRFSKAKILQFLFSFII